MARRSISIFESFLSGGNVGSNVRSLAKAILNASTLIRSLVACASRYFCVARLLRRLSSRVDTERRLGVVEVTSHWSDPTEAASMNI